VSKVRTPVRLFEAFCAALPRGNMLPPPRDADAPNTKHTKETKDFVLRRDRKRHEVLRFLRFLLLSNCRVPVCAGQDHAHCTRGQF
jgi:hypothetical protein